MPTFAVTPPDLATIAAGLATGAAAATPALRPGPRPGPHPTQGQGPREVSIWEITTWILPMAPEHLRRVLAADPDLPQGRAETEGGTRWFSLAEVATLRRHFAAVAARHPGGRAKSYAPRRPPGAKAPLLALCAPQGQAGRSTTLLHLACAAALGGTRVLVLDADPAGRLAADLGANLETTLEATPDPSGPGLLPLIARSAGLHLRRLNAGRMDRGEAPLAMDQDMAAALETEASALIRPTAWPGLDIIAASPALLGADQQIGTWRNALRSWQPGTALATALDREGLRDRYDLILCDTGRGLGPLVLAVLTSADMLLIPQAEGAGAGLSALAAVVEREAAAARATAQALGQPAPAFGWRWTGTLPQPLPRLPQVASGATPHLYALDYREIGRLAYAPLREGCEAAWASLAVVLAGVLAVSDSAAPGQSL